MPKYMIELEGRDKDHPMSTAIVRDENGEEIGRFSAVLTEVALIGALQSARGGGSSFIWSGCVKAEAQANDTEMFK